MAADEDATLAEQAKTNGSAFAVLYNRYVDRIYGFVYRRTGDEMLAQDITAVTFEKALRALPRYREQGVGFCAWLYTIARNEVVSHYRRQPILSLLRVDQPAPQRLEWLVEYQETLATLSNAFSQLSASDQELLTLRFWEDLSTKQIAAVLNCTVDAMYVRLHRALGRIRQRYDTLQECHPEPVCVHQVRRQETRMGRQEE